MMWSTRCAAARALIRPALAALLAAVLLTGCGLGSDDKAPAPQPTGAATATIERDSGAAAAATVVGPVTGGVHGSPFSAPTVDLADYGYVMEEFFLDGTATSYEAVPGTTLGTDGRWSVQRAGKAPFRTRILVVRPDDEDDFNGTVVLNWQNVTAGVEYGSVYGGEILRGYAWVGVSAQKVGIDGFPGPDPQGLKVWDTERYGSLEHPGDPYSYDMFAQAGRAVGPDRPELANDPMGGLEVQRLLATGVSQSAARLRTYINAVHPLEGVFHGYLPSLDFGWTTPLEEAAAGDADGSSTAGMFSGHAQIRTDLGVPVLIVNSETEVLSHYAVRQPDTDMYRFWEVAGAPHFALPRAETAPGAESANWLSHRPVFEAALRHMQDWLSGGDPPPSQPRVEVEPGSPPTIRRDSYGNALGGIRLPDFAVPTAEHRGVGEGGGGGEGLSELMSFLAGYARNLSCDELASLYPSHEAYVGAYDSAVDASVAAEVILPEDAPELKEKAEASTVGTDEQGC